MQPLWSPSGDLIFISDRSGFWNLYTEHSGSVKALLPMQAEFSTPAWVFGIRSYQILPDGRYDCVPFLPHWFSMLLPLVSPAMPHRLKKGLTGGTQDYGKSALGKLYRSML